MNKNLQDVLSPQGFYSGLDIFSKNFLDKSPKCQLHVGSWAQGFAAEGVRSLGGIVLYVCNVCMYVSLLLCSSLSLGSPTQSLKWTVGGNNFASENPCPRFNVADISSCPLNPSFNVGNT